MVGNFPRIAALAIPLLLSIGCNSPYYADRGALMGGLGGAGVGALVGNAVGNTGAGAAIGAATGVIAGAAIGGGLDDIEARNRAEIEARMGRPVAVGAVTIPDVVAMSQAGVAEDLIISHVQTNGFAGTLQSSDLIYLQQQGVATRVIQAMQVPRAQPVVVHPAPVAMPAPVIVEEYHYGPYWGPRYYHHHHHHRRHRHGTSWGVSVSN